MSAIPASETAGPPPFLADLGKSYVGELIVVHTGRGTYVGRLMSITPDCVTLDADSDSLDQQVFMRVDTRRIEAVELLPI
jgi:hypothetical protein